MPSKFACAAVFLLGLLPAQVIRAEPPVKPSPQTGRAFVEAPPLPQPARKTGPVAEIEISSEEDGLALQDLLNLACQHNPTLRQARAQIGAAMGTAIQAGLYPNPVVAYAAEQIGVEGTPGEFHGAIFRQTIPTARKLRLSRAKYLQRVKAAEALSMAQQYRVCNDIKVHYYDVLGHRQLVEIHQELVKSAEDAALTARELYNVGQANRSAVLRSNVTLQRARLDLLAVENRFQQKFRRLSALVGIELAQVHLEGELQGDTEAIDFHDAWAKLRTASPQLLAARAKLRGDQYTLARERAEPIPNLRLEGGVGYNYEAEESVAVAGVAIEVPVWDRNQGTIRQARADLARQQAEISRVELMLRRDLANTYERYLTALQHVIQYQKVILPDARQAYRLLLESYQRNRADWPSVLAAQREYFDARIQYIHQLVHWRQSEVIINGMMLHGGLMPAESSPPPGHIDATPRPR